MARKIPQAPSHVSPVNDGKFSSIWGGWFGNIHDSIKTMDADLASAEADFAALDATVTAIDADLTTAEADIAALESDVTTITGDITAIESDITAIESDISNLQSDVTDLQNGSVVVRAYASGTTSVSAATWTQVALAGETIDNTNIFASNAATIAIAGNYLVSATIRFTTLESCGVRLLVNGTATSYFMDNNSTQTVSLTDVLVLAVSDVVTVEAVSSTAATVDTNSEYTYFSLVKI